MSYMTKIGIRWCQFGFVSESEGFVSQRFVFGRSSLVSSIRHFCHGLLSSLCVSCLFSILYESGRDINFCPRYLENKEISNVGIKNLCSVCEKLAAAPRAVF